MICLLSDETLLGEEIVMNDRPQKKGVKKIGSTGVKRKTPYSEARLCT